MDFQEFVEMMIKVWMNDSYHNYQYDHGRSVPISGVRATKVSRCVFLQRESEKETVQELKQAFRVFDKVQLGI